MIPPHIKRKVKKLDARIAEGFAYLVIEKGFPSRKLFPKGGKVGDISPNLKAIICYMNHAPQKDLEDLFRDYA